MGFDFVPSSSTCENPFNGKSLIKIADLFFLPLHQHALDAAVGNEPQEGDEHIQAARNPRTHERELDGEWNLSLLFLHQERQQ